jgi:tRNA modification GTPase
VVLLVDDVSDQASMINQRAGMVKEMIRGSDKRLVIVINKIDTAGKGVTDKLRQDIPLTGNDSLLFISAKEHTGLDELREKLGILAEADRIESEDVIVTNIRHSEALKHVSESLGRVIAGLDEQLPEDLIAMDIRQAIHYLGEITGQITSDEILGNIFRNFCIGK